MNAKIYLGTRIIVIFYRFVLVPRRWDRRRAGQTACECVGAVHGFVVLVAAGACTATSARSSVHEEPHGPGGFIERHAINALLLSVRNGSTYSLRYCSFWTFQCATIGLRDCVGLNAGLLPHPLVEGGTSIPVSMDRARMRLISSRMPSVVVQKYAGLFVQPIWRDDGMTKKLPRSPGRGGSWYTKLYSFLCSTIMRQKPSDRSTFCQSISQSQWVSNMNSRRLGRAKPRALTASWSLGSSVISLTDGCLHFCLCRELFFR